jgi:hypothetical protein
MGPRKPLNPPLADNLRRAARNKTRKDNLYKKRRIAMNKVITICLMCMFAGTALADIAITPDWRGLPGTVTAEWDSWSGSSSSMSPDYWTSNPSLPQFPPNAGTDGTLLSEFEGRTDVIELTGDYQIEFSMPNFPPNDHKEMLVQVTYYATTSFQFSWLDVVADEADIGQTFIGAYYMGEGWWTDVWSVQIYPNPESETIFVNFSDMYGTGESLYPAYLDQVVIDTWCVPEPATICLLGLGALSLIRRKR